MNIIAKPFENCGKEQNPFSCLRISLMGSEGCGKTCFFAGLAWLGGAAEKSDFGLVGRNEPSQKFVNDLRDTLARYEVPTPTPSTDELSLDIIYKEARIGVDTENFSGEEFREVGSEIRTDSPLFTKFLASRYLVLFLDIEKDVDQTVSGNAERLNAVLNILSTRELCDGKRKLAIVLTKSDLKGFIGEKATSAVARDYLAEHKAGLFEKIERLGFEKQFFFLAPLGRTSLADGAPPTPFGYETLFSWLVSDLRREKIWSWCLCHKALLLTTTAIILLSAGAYVVQIGVSLRANRVLENPSGHTSSQILEALSSASQTAKDTYADSRVGEIVKIAANTDSLDGLKKLQDEVTLLNRHVTTTVQKRLDELARQLSDKREDVHIAKINELMAGKSFVKARDAIAVYHTDGLIGYKRKDEVKRISSRIDNAEINSKRQEIRKALVVSGQPHTLQNRCNLVDKFPFPDPQTKGDARRAVDVARRFLAESSYDIEIKSATGLSKPSRTRLEFSNLGPKSPLQKVETEHLESSEPQWNKKVSIRWQPGDSIRIEWYWKACTGLASTLIGHDDFNDPWTSLLDVLGGVDLKPKTGLFHANIYDTPRAKIECKQFPDPKNDKRLFERYIAPGTYWED